MRLTDQGLKDGLIALADIRRTLAAQANDAILRAETALKLGNDLKKLIGFADQQIDEYREELRRRQEQQ